MLGALALPVQRAGLKFHGSGPRAFRGKYEAASLDLWLLPNDPARKWQGFGPQILKAKRNILVSCIQEICWDFSKLKSVLKCVKKETFCRTLKKNLNPKTRSHESQRHHLHASGPDIDGPGLEDSCKTAAEKEQIRRERV